MLRRISGVQVASKVDGKAMEGRRGDLHKGRRGDWR